MQSETTSGKDGVPDPTQRYRPPPEVWQVAGLSVQARFAYLALYQLVGACVRVQLDLESFASATHASGRSVRRWLCELERAGWVSIARRSFARGSPVAVTLHAQPVRLADGEVQGTFEFMSPAAGEVPRPVVFLPDDVTDPPMPSRTSVSLAAQALQPRKEVTEVGEDAELARLINAKRRESARPASDSLNVSRFTEEISHYVPTLKAPPVPETSERREIFESENVGSSIVSQETDQPSSAPAARDGTVFTGGLYDGLDVRAEILAHARRIWIKCDDRKLFPWVAILAAEQAAAGSFSRADLDGEVDSALQLIRAGKARPGMRAGGLLVGWLRRELGAEFVRYKSYRAYFEKARGRWRHGWFTAADVRQPGFWT